jgi:hypothetical protein
LKRSSPPSRSNCHAFMRDSLDAERLDMAR